MNRFSSLGRLVSNEEIPLFYGDNDLGVLGGKGASSSSPPVHQICGMDPETARFDYYYHIGMTGQRFSSRSRRVPARLWALWVGQLPKQADRMVESSSGEDFLHFHGCLFIVILECAVSLVPPSSLLATGTGCTVSVSQCSKQFRNKPP